MRSKDTIRYLTEEQLERFFSVIKSPRDIATFRVIYHRALRASEVGRIQLSDWNRERDRLRFSRVKGSFGGEYLLTQREVKALRSWLRVRGTDPGPLFRSRKGKGISQPQLDRLMKRYGAAAGLPRELCHVHVLKHSSCTHLLNKGLDFSDIQDHAGHKNIQNTLIYARYSARRRSAREEALRDW